MGHNSQHLFSFIRTHSQKKKNNKRALYCLWHGCQVRPGEINLSKIILLRGFIMKTTLAESKQIWLTSGHSSYVKHTRKQQVTRQGLQPEMEGELEESSGTSPNYLPSSPPPLPRLSLPSHPLDNVAIYSKTANLLVVKLQ